MSKLPVHALKTSSGSLVTLTGSPTVPSAVPGAPQNLQILANGTTFLISWEPPLALNGSPTWRYAITISGGAGAGTFYAHRFSRNYLAVGLAFATAYNVSVAAQNALGSGVAATQNGVSTLTQADSTYDPFAAWEPGGVDDIAVSWVNGVSPAGVTPTVFVARNGVSSAPAGMTLVNGPLGMELPGTLWTQGTVTSGKEFDVSLQYVSPTDATWTKGNPFKNLGEVQDSLVNAAIYNGSGTVIWTRCQIYPPTSTLQDNDAGGAIKATPIIARYCDVGAVSDACDPQSGTFLQHVRLGAQRPPALNGKAFNNLPPARLDTAAGTKASATITDSNIQAGDAGKPVTGKSIPANTFVGTVTPGASFLLSSSATSQVNVKPTGAVTSVAIGGYQTNAASISGNYVQQSYGTASGTSITAGPVNGVPQYFKIDAKNQNDNQIACECIVSGMLNNVSGQDANIPLTAYSAATNVAGPNDPCTQPYIIKDGVAQAVTYTLNSDGTINLSSFNNTIDGVTYAVMVSTGFFVHSDGVQMTAGNKHLLEHSYVAAPASLSFFADCNSTANFPVSNMWAIDSRINGSFSAWGKGTVSGVLAAPVPHGASHPPGGFYRDPGNGDAWTPYVHGSQLLDGNTGTTRKVLLGNTAPRSFRMIRNVIGPLKSGAYPLTLLGNVPSGPNTIVDGVGCNGALIAFPGTVPVSSLEVQLQNIVNQYNYTFTTEAITLSASIAGGTSRSSIPVDNLPAAVPAGSMVMVSSADDYQIFTVDTAGAAATGSSTTVPIVADPVASGLNFTTLRPLPWTETNTTPRITFPAGSKVYIAYNNQPPPSSTVPPTYGYNSDLASMAFGDFNWPAWEAINTGPGIINQPVVSNRWSPTDGSSGCGIAGVDARCQVVAKGNVYDQNAGALAGVEITNAGVPTGASYDADGCWIGG